MLININQVKEIFDHIYYNIIIFPNAGYISSIIFGFVIILLANLVFEKITLSLNIIEPYLSESETEDTDLISDTITSSICLDNIEYKEYTLEKEYLLGSDSESETEERISLSKYQRDEIRINNYILKGYLRKLVNFLFKMKLTNTVILRAKGQIIAGITEKINGSYKLVIESTPMKVTIKLANYVRINHSRVLICILI